MGYGNVVILRSGLLKAIVESSPAKTGARGRPQEYSDIAIETILFIRQVFYLQLCQTEGFMNSLARVMKADITIADQLYSWDITYLASIILGQFFCLYFPRYFQTKVVGWTVYEEENSAWQAKRRSVTRPMLS